MNNIRKRLLLFLGGCIGARALLVYLAKTLPDENLKYMAYGAFAIACGFAYIYIFNARTTGPEVFGDLIWWNSLRPVHAFLYFTFAYLAIHKSSYAWIPLLIDVVLGLSAFVMYRKTYYL